MRELGRLIAAEVLERGRAQTVSGRAALKRRYDSSQVQPAGVKP
jgi:hypothetical protein